MDEERLKEFTSRIKKADSLIKSLDATIRARAFELLVPYVTEGLAPPVRQKGERHSGFDGEKQEIEEFFGSHQASDPAEAVLLIAAYFFSRYGSQAFSLQEVDETASAVGLTIPSRPDMTLRVAKREGKKLFKKAGRSQFSPTVHGETFLKATYQVTKGRQARPASESA